MKTIEYKAFKVPSGQTGLVAILKDGEAEIILCTIDKATFDALACVREHFRLLVEHLAEHIEIRVVGDELMFDVDSDEAPAHLH